MSQVASSNFVSVPTTAISGAGTTNGAWVNMRSMSRVSFQAVWTGTLSGTFAWQITNSPPDSAKPSQPVSSATPTTLTVPASFSAGNPAGSAGDFDFQFTNMAELWIRPAFTWSSGSGNLTVLANAKG